MPKPKNATGSARWTKWTQPKVDPGVTYAEVTEEVAPHEVPDKPDVGTGHGIGFAQLVTRDNRSTRGDY